MYLPRLYLPRLYLPLLHVPLRHSPLRHVQDDGSVVRLPLPEDEEQGTHLYLSHAWRHAQEQCGTIKALLYTMLPTCRVFLDVDEHASEAPSCYLVITPIGPVSSV